MSKRKKQPVFKAYNPHQMSLLPPSLEELIPENHVVRVVQQVIDQLDLDPILKKYKSRGASNYHPKLMLKVIVYGYLSNIYSSRKIEQAVQSNIHFMWLAGMQRPDHNTINRFRSEKLKGVLKEVFTQVVLLMAETGLVDIKTIYIDGTKLEANANKFTFVWGKSIKTSKERIHKQLKELWAYAESIAASELQDNDPTTYEQIDSEKVSKTISSINEALKDKPIDKKVKQKLNYAKKNWPANLDKYKDQEEQLGPRNSMSKTDPDATFMRMKDDYMKNGQLKAAYNWQISTSGQCIVNYDLYQTTSDTVTLPDHLNSYQQMYDTYPEVAVADSAYGSEQNYELMEQQGIEAYVKYNYFHKEQTRKRKIPAKECFRPEHLYYNDEEDYYICPMGQKMSNVGQDSRITKNGFEQHFTLYQAQRCEGCPLRGACHKAQSNRQIQINHRLKRYKDKATKLLTSQQGLKHRSQRPVDVEAVFGNIKQNKKFTRFLLRGLDKVMIEAGLIALAHNLAKMAG